MTRNNPKHIAIIMDGNGRWAKERRLSRLAGHKAGIEAVRAAIKTCQELGIEVLSLFAFSSENWQRPSSEVKALMQLFKQTLSKEIAELHHQNIKLRFIGSRERLGKTLVNLMQSSEELTAQNSGTTLVIAIDYGGMWDIVNASKEIATQLAQKQVTRDEIDESFLQQFLSLSDLPNPDLFIRTSGEQRLSNFFLWQLAYTELYFSDCYWPDFGREQLLRAIEWFAGRERRFGFTSEQMRTSACLPKD